MTRKKNIEHLILTEKLQLSRREKLKHFQVVLFLLLITIFCAFILIKIFIDKPTRPLDAELILTVCIPAILTIFFYKLQKGRLKFKTVTTKLSYKELNQIVEKVAAKLEWAIYTKKSKIIIAKTHPGFFSGSWGEEITIIFDINRILVNSICDLSKRTSLTSMGRNQENMNTLIEEIKKANQ